MSRWAVVVTGEMGEARAYGLWRDKPRARAFASKLIDRDLDAQTVRIEPRTLKAVFSFFGEPE